MSDEHFRKLFSKNLNYYMKRQGIKQSDIVKHFNLAKSTVSSWCTGAKLPRMDKIESLANFLDINKSDLFGEEKFEYISNFQRIFNKKLKDETRSIEALAREMRITKEDLQKYTCDTDIDYIPHEIVIGFAWILGFNEREYFSCINEKELEYYIGIPTKNGFIHNRDGNIIPWNIEIRCGDDSNDLPCKCAEVFSKLSTAGKEKVIDYAKLVYNSEKNQ